MRPFVFERAGSPAAAVLAAAGQAEGDEEAQFLAGGTTLIDLMKLDVMRPETVTADRSTRTPRAAQRRRPSRGLFLASTTPSRSSSENARWCAPCEVRPPAGLMPGWRI